MRFPIFITIYLKDQELIGRLDYDGSSSSSFLQGKSIRSGQWMLQEIDHDENLIGFIELNGSLPRSIQSMRWYNAERSRSFPLYLGQLQNTYSAPGEGILRYQSKRKDPCREVYLKALPKGYQLNAKLESGKDLNVLLEPVVAEPEGLFKGNTSETKDLRYEQASNRLVFSDGRVCRLKKGKQVGQRHLQSQLNFSELLWIDLPKLEDAVFNIKMKGLINQYLFNSGCSNNLRDGREHWRHYRKAEAEIAHFDKYWISLNLRILNSCSASPTDTVLHINYARKEKQFMPLHTMQKKMQEAGKTVPSCPDCQETPKGYTLNNEGMVIHHGFDLYHGACFCRISWEKLGFKNSRKWLRTLK